MAWIPGPVCAAVDSGTYPAVLDGNTDKNLKAPNVTKANIVTYSQGVYEPPGRGTGSYPVGGP